MHTYEPLPGADDLVENRSYHYHHYRRYCPGLRDWAPNGPIKHTYPDGRVTIEPDRPLPKYGFIRPTVIE
jgi:hypothetical protein